MSNPIDTNGMDGVRLMLGKTLTKEEAALKGLKAQLAGVERSIMKAEARVEITKQIIAGLDPTGEAK